MNPAKEMILKEVVDEAREEIERMDRQQFPRAAKHEKFVDVPKYKMVRDGVLKVPAEKISAPNIAVDLIRREIEVQQNHFGEGREYMVLVLLNVENYPIFTKTIAVGGDDHVFVDPADVFGLVLSPHFQAKGFILGHNHPSGRIFLSEEDKGLIQEYKDLGTRFRRPMRDFIVLGDGVAEYYSHRNQSYEL